MLQLDELMELKLPWQVEITKSGCLGSMVKNKPCRKCISICPQQAISLNKNKISREEEKCIHCGLCSRVCPEEVFSSHYINKTLQENINEQVQAGHESICVTCFKSNEKAVDSIKVGCLGSLHVEQLITWGLKGLNHIGLDTRKCRRCSINGFDLIRETAAQANSVLKHLGFSARVSLGKLDAEMLAAEKRKTKSEGIDRRGFLAMIKQEAVRSMSTVIDKAQEMYTVERNDHQKNEERAVVKLVQEKGSLPFRKEFLSILVEQGVKTINLKGTDWPWTGLERKGSCSKCKVCSMFCWSGAIKREQHKDGYTLLWDGSKCNGCGYCVGACPEKILALNQEWNFTEEKEL